MAAKHPSFHAACIVVQQDLTAQAHINAVWALSIGELSVATLCQLQQRNNHMRARSHFHLMGFDPNYEMDQ